MKRFFPLMARSPCWLSRRFPPAPCAQKTRISLLRELRTSPDGYKRLRAIQETLCSKSHALSKALGTGNDPKKADRTVVEMNELTHQVNLIERELFSQFSSAL